MLFNPQFANNIPHEYLATAKFKNQLENFNEISNARSTTKFINDKNC
jgi:hypothetical protein